MFILLVIIGVVALYELFGWIGLLIAAALGLGALSELGGIALLVGLVIGGICLLTSIFSD